MWDKIIAIITANWSFLAIALILGLIGDVTKQVVNGDDPEAAKKVLWKSIFIRTQPLHLTLGGALFGLILTPLAPPFVGAGLVGGVLYYALAGALSTFVFHIAETAAPELMQYVRVKLNPTNLVSRKAAPKSDDQDNQDQ